MPNRRRQSKHTREFRPLSGHHPSAEVRADGEWLVGGIPTGRSQKDYTCPGCGGRIAAGVKHLVVWPSQAPIGTSQAVEARRHWHEHCWRRH